MEMENEDSLFLRQLSDLQVCVFFRLKLKHGHGLCRRSEAASQERGKDLSNLTQALHI